MNNSEWLKAYRTNKNATWAKFRLCTGEMVYSDDISNCWTDLVERCKREKKYVKGISLQFRSHEVNLEMTDDMEGIYLAKGCLGQIGSATKHFIVFGRIRGNEVHKESWLTPDLILESTSVDKIQDCIPEAILYDEKKARENREE